LATPVLGLEYEPCHQLRVALGLLDQRSDEVWITRQGTLFELLAQPKSLRESEHDTQNPQTQKEGGVGVGVGWGAIANAQHRSCAAALHRIEEEEEGFTRAVAVKSSSHQGIKSSSHQDIKSSRHQGIKS